MHETLLRDLYNVLQRVFDPKPLNPKPILLILDQYIYSNPLFSETEPDMRSIIADLDLGVRVIPSFFDANIRIVRLKCILNDENSSWNYQISISIMFTTLLTHSSTTSKDFTRDSRILSSGTNLHLLCFDEIEKWIFFSSELTYSSLSSSKMFKLCCLRSCARPLKTELSYRPKTCLKSTGKLKSYGTFIVRLCKSKSHIVHC